VVGVGGVVGVAAAGRDEEDAGAVAAGGGVEALRRVSESSVAHGEMRCSSVAGSQVEMQVVSSFSAKT
jgi:hypothetical protein